MVKHSCGSVLAIPGFNGYRFVRLIFQFHLAHYPLPLPSRPRPLHREALSALQFLTLTNTEGSRVREEVWQRLTFLIGLCGRLSAKVVTMPLLTSGEASLSPTPKLSWPCDLL